MRWKNLDASYENQIERIRSSDPYERLGIDRGGSIAEVKAAYRKKMRLYHPDKTDSFMTIHGEEISKLLNQAVGQITKDLKNDS